MPIDPWIAAHVWRKSSACGWDARWRTITPLAGMQITGECPAKKFAPGCEVRRWKSNGVWMVPTGCASAAVISACTTAQHPFAPRVLPGYRLHDSRSEEQNHYTKSKPNTT